jgi:molecular chaperone DnaK
MITEAERFAEEDRKRREAAEARNAADQLSYQIEKALKEWGDKVPEAERGELQRANDELKEALKGDDVERIRRATDAAMQVFQRVGQAMYERVQPGAQQAAAAGGSASSGPGEGEVVEGEVVDEGDGSS